MRVFPRNKITFLDITEPINALIQKEGGVEGMAHLYTRHTTTAIRVNENESNLVRDFHEFMESLIPASKEYHRDKLHLRDCPADEPKNARAHLMALMLGSSESIPFRDGKLMLGLWQSIFFIDCDGGRPDGREILVTIVSP
ncbi:YjbQ family protein [Candidatus Peregrinibacteria bacterium]|nr:YjbQ family protein [Candidatus Peregrinibacteria bacterium]